MNLEAYYYDINTRLFALMILGLLLSGLYLKYLNSSTQSSFLKREKNIYFMHITYWLLFLFNIFALILPVNIFGFFTFEFITLAIILISFTFLLWKFFKKNTFDFGIFFVSLPLIMLFILALGMD